MKRFLAAILTFATLACFAGARVTVCDEVEKTPIAGASVISAKGIIIGFTDAEGHIDVKPQDFPLSVRCLGYEASTTSVPADSILLTAATFDLPEVVISTKERPIIRVLTYVREYCTGASPNDTLQLYTEAILEYFLADGKVKGYSHGDKSAHELTSRRYGRIAHKNKPESVFMPKEHDRITVLSLYDIVAELPYELTEETEAMRNGATADTIMGKYFPKYIYRKANNHFIIEMDQLADEETHTNVPFMFKMMGFTLEFEKGSTSTLYKQNSLGKYGINDFFYNTYNLHMLGKGKWIKKIAGVNKNLDMDCYIEQYPIDIKRLTIEEYKALKKDGSRRDIPIEVPDYAQPLAPAIQTLIDRAGNQTR